MTDDRPDGVAVYVHWPYCARICPYCDFNVVKDRGWREEKAVLVQAILTDLEALPDLPRITPREALARAVRHAAWLISEGRAAEAAPLLRAAEALDRMAWRADG